MNYSALSLAQTPPLTVPLKFMLTAPFFAALAALILLMNPEALANRWTPAMLAATHLLTLGFITMVMLGALQQLFPVLFGVNLTRPVLTSWLIYSGFVFGTLILSTGFLTMQSEFLSVGAILIGVVLFFTILYFAWSLLRSSAARPTAGLRLALLSFMLTIVLGLFLTAGYTSQAISLNRSLTLYHIGWGLLGWVSILIFTVSYQTVPMFQVTPKYPEMVVRFLTPSVFMLLLLISLAELISAPLLVTSVLEILLAALFILYAFITLRLQASRQRKVADVTLDYWRFGLFCLVLTVVLILIFEFTDLVFSGYDLLVGILMIIGFIQSVINGMLYKIIPFLVWLHLTNAIDMKQRWQMRIPNMKKIVTDKNARNQYRLFVASVVMLLASLVLDELIRLAAIFMIASNLFLALNLVRGVSVYYRTVRQFDELEAMSGN